MKGWEHLLVKIPLLRYLIVSKAPKYLSDHYEEYKKVLRLNLKQPIYIYKRKSKYAAFVNNTAIFFVKPWYGKKISEGNLEHVEFVLGHEIGHITKRHLAERHVLPTEIKEKEANQAASIYKKRLHESRKNK